VIYMVEHTFALPELEAEWNAWYGGNLQVLLSVPGIGSAQRFRVAETSPPRYMAMYTVAGPEVFESDAYRNAGGGGANSMRFRPAYRVWVRNLFAGIETAPEVQPAQRLLALDAPDGPRTLAGITLAWGQAIALHRTTPWRGLAVVSAQTARAVTAQAGLTVYAPHGPRLSA